MKHPPLPPVRWKYEHEMCGNALDAMMEELRDHYPVSAMYYARDAAAHAVLGWAREQILKNDTGSISKIYDWNAWLEAKEQAETSKAARKGTK